MTAKDEVPWEGQCLDEARAFALRCVALRDSNPYGRPPLEVIMVDLMTELWDRSFSQTEIRMAFEQAISELPQYAAGEERRGGRR
ncbi:MAG: hypothetical protein JSR91_02975 [Proteobacteria bacterium]|nr:hypothetical protein [Pseudomonadota bacterium]